jgi:hypothetical protein
MMPHAWTREIREPARLERLALYVVVAIPIALNAIALLPELTTSVANLNDDAFHWAFVQRGIDALARGENVLEFWVPQFGLGFPQFLYYQSLPHLFVIFLDRVLFGVVDAYTLFNLVRYLLLVTFPLTVFWSLRRMELPVPAAAFGAAASSLISTDHLYGFDYNSYVFRGFGTYTQLWAMHLSFIALASVYRLIQRGEGYLATTVALAALGFSHILYAYMAVITSLVMTVVGLTARALVARIARLAVAGAASGLVTAYATVPNVLSANLYVDYGPYLERWKYDSFGAPRVLELLVSGELLDHGRLPLFTALLGVGIFAALVVRTRVALTVLALFAVWLVIFFGRPTLGVIADLMPLSSSLFFHRFIGGVHLAAVPLIGLGAAWLWERLSGNRTRRLIGTSALLVALLIPAIAERSAYYAQNAEWMRTTNQAIRGDADAQAILSAIAALPPARTYAGLRSNWGEGLNFGLTFNSTRFYNVLTYVGLPEVAPPYAGPSLNADLLWNFDDQRLELYDLFDVRYVVAPSGRPMPSFLRSLVQTSRYTLFEAPTTGMAEYVAVADRRASSSQPVVFEENLAWLASQDVAAKRFIRWDYPATTDRSGAQTSPGCPQGSTKYERIQPSRVDLIVECPTAATLAIKVTYHPNWVVTVDDQPAKTFMLSPSYLGIELPAGSHFVVAEYRSTSAKIPLLGVGILGLAIGVAGDRWLRRREWWSRT